ncbi:MAG: hypothetical protein M3144_04155 [Actinomycetota bacterium]|nr:hypothetical protein [Actinomycetota bacterium]
MWPRDQRDGHPGDVERATRARDDDHVRFHIDIEHDEDHCPRRGSTLGPGTILRL